MPSPVLTIRVTKHGDSFTAVAEGAMPGTTQLLRRATGKSPLEAAKAVISSVYDLADSRQYGPGRKPRGHRVANYLVTGAESK